MAKKTESKQTGKTVTPTAPENKAVISGNISEKADSVPESVSEEQEPVSGDEKTVEILNNDAELREDLTETLNISIHTPAQGVTLFLPDEGLADTVEKIKGCLTVENDVKITIDAGDMEE